MKNSLPENPSEDFKAGNPHLYPVGGLQATEPKPDSAQALEGGVEKFNEGKGGMVVCTLVSHRKRLLDDDNCVGSFKALRDAIAKSIGIDDGDPRVVFHCSQIQTRGAEGTVVTLQVLK